MNDTVRRAGWVILGIGGLPAALIGVLVLVGPFWILLVGILAALLARWAAVDHLMPVLMTWLFIAGIVPVAYDAIDRGDHGLRWFAWMAFLYLSAWAMTLSAPKLGRMAGIAAWNRERPRQRTQVEKRDSTAQA